MKLATVLALLFACVFAGAQTPPPVVNSSQYQVNLSFLTGGPYAQSSALDITFGSQFTTNNMLQAEFITMPGPSYTGYLGGDSYNLCAISAVEKLLATTSLSCGKFMPFVTGEVGLGRIEPTTGYSGQSLAALAGLGIGYDPTSAGHFSLLFKGGWGHFGPSIPAVSSSPALSSNGFYFYSGFNFGGGTNAAATQAKLERMNRAQSKKLKKLQERAARMNKS
jgi:hypothetical protein